MTSEYSLVLEKGSMKTIDQSEGRQGEDAKEGAAHIVALLA